MLPSPLVRILRWLLAAGLLVWLAGRHWYDTVDDVYITLAYAEAWAKDGVLHWTTGERVEGFSNLLFVGELAAGIGAGLDGALLAQLLAMAAALGVLLHFSWRLPTHVGGTATLLALAGWAPLAYWSAVGMETTTFALVLAAGWSLALAGPWGAGVLLLGVGALLRPEGTVWLLGGLAARMLHGRTPRLSDHLGHLGVTLVVAWQTWRIGYFGEAWPTPMLVKLGPIDGGIRGLYQAGGDVLVAAGWLGGIALLTKVPPRLLPWVVLPTVGQALVLVRADGDWMGWSRLMLPGLLATGAAWLALGTPREVSRAGIAGVVTLGLLGTVSSPGSAEAPSLRLRDRPVSPAEGYGEGLHTPFDADVAWMVDNLPEGARVLTVDVGMVGNIPGVRVLDMHGLVWRPCAEALAYGDHRGFLWDVVNAEDPPELLRFGHWDGGVAEGWLEEALPARYHLRHEVRYSERSFTRWYALDDTVPPPEVARARWETLAARFPSHRFLVTQRDRAAGLVWALDPTSFPEATAHPWTEDRGLALFWAATVKSRAWSRADLEHLRLRLDADAPGAEGAWAWLTWRGACGEQREKVTVFGPQVVPLTAPCDGEGPFTVDVQFENDVAGPDGDRNLYVGLERRG